mmetsp:Transcript_58701/g.164711  ORF Transcript_58701/g.164711 Transcript_58701/m.164711 type:complete len:203 (+) Transcript_58701:164-772(+)
MWMGFNLPCFFLKSSSMMSATASVMPNIPWPTFTRMFDTWTFSKSTSISGESSSSCFGFRASPVAAVSSSDDVVEESASSSPCTFASKTPKFDSSMLVPRVSKLTRTSTSAISSMVICLAAPRHNCLTYCQTLTSTIILLAARRFSFSKPGGFWMLMSSISTLPEQSDTFMLPMLMSTPNTSLSTRSTKASIDFPRMREPYQ